MHDSRNDTVKEWTGTCPKCGNTRRFNHSQDDSICPDCKERWEMEPNTNLDQQIQKLLQEDVDNAIKRLKIAASGQINEQ